MDEDRDRRRHEEAVAEASVPAARAVVQPDEEHRGQDEVADEVEEVHRLDELGHAEERTLQRLLPREIERALEVVHALRVRHRDRPVRMDHHPRELVRPNRTEHDQDLA